MRLYVNASPLEPLLIKEHCGRIHNGAMVFKGRILSWLGAAALLLAADAGVCAPGIIGTQESVFDLQAVGALSPRTLADMLVGCGIEVTDVRFVGSAISAGVFSTTEYGKEIIGFKEGLILSSGSILSIKGPNTSNSTSSSNGLPGDEDLNGLITQTSYDATILEFDFIPSGTIVTFDYVFSSEEYNEFVNTTFNDVFGFFLNGSNVALIPGTAMAVSINNVNNGNPIGVAPISASEYYIDNAIGTATVMNSSAETLLRFQELEMDGLTVVFTVTATVMAGKINRMKFAVADAGDSIYDSNVFIRTGSFSIGGCGGTGQVAPPSVDTSASDALHAFPNPFRPGSAAGFDAARIEIRGVPAGATVRIYSLSGVLVAEMVDLDGDGIEFWDGKNKEGNKVASGIYHMVATASPASGGEIRKRGKIVIIR